MPGFVRPKKSLGQHFLHDQRIAQKIVDALLHLDQFPCVLEIGPGKGVLTRFLLEKNGIDLKTIEIDSEAIAFLSDAYPQIMPGMLKGDVLKLSFAQIFPGQFSVIGNFPYNISSQIFFRVLDARKHVVQVVCMLQKEVAMRIASKHGNKTYGILSVLLQAFYSVEMLFSVPPGVFTPPPKVTSAVIRFTRNSVDELPCDEALFFQVVKQGFNNRRKTLRNALKPINLAPVILPEKVFDKRAEQLSVEEFIQLVILIQKSRAGDHPLRVNP